jgi:hypothetical protein
VTVTAKIDALIREAERWRVFHKQRGQLGYIEALAADIRIKAFNDAKDAVSGNDR